MNLADLKNIILRVEQVESEMTPLREELRDIYATAKDQGFNPKLVRKLVSLRKQAGPAAKEELDTLSTWIETLQ